MLAQHRALTPEIAVMWREGHEGRLRANGAEIREALQQVVRLFAEREGLEQLDQALERVERRDPAGWRFPVAPLDVAYRQAAKRVDKMIQSWTSAGVHWDSVPNNPGALIAALDVLTRWWEIKRDRENAHRLRGEIVAEVAALKLRAQERDAEIHRRCDEAGIPSRP